MANALCSCLTLVLVGILVAAGSDMKVSQPTVAAPASTRAAAVAPAPPKRDPAGQVRWVIERFKAEPMTRIVAIGSSNTAKGYHCEGRYNWVDWLDVGLSQWWGRKHITINAGVSGQTCRQCLDRFDRDVALFRPNMVIVTLGGNDALPPNGVSVEQFRKDLGEMVDRIEAMSQCVAVLQTYYSFDVERMTGKEQARAENFARYMQAVRQVARDKGVPLIDHLSRWELLRQADPKTYRSCMRDPLHLSPLGHEVFGLDVLRFLDSGLDKNLKEMCQPAYAIQAQLDELQRQTLAEPATSLH